MAECTCVLYETVDYFYNRIQEGKYKAIKGHSQPAPFSYFLKLRLQEVPRRLAKENQSISLPEGIARIVHRIQNFIENYEKENSGNSPNADLIAKTFGIEYEKAKEYLEIVNRTVISGDEPMKASQSAEYRETGESVFEIAEDIRARFDSGDQFDQLVVDYAVQRLGTVRSIIIAMKYGMLGFKVHTDKEIVRTLKIPKKTFDRLLSETLKELEGKLEDFRHDKRPH